MAEYRIQNKEISIMVNSFGAELKSLKENAGNTEYMWNADPAYWKRTSPILFPFVGSLKNKEYTYEGKTYPMSQHGFARDMEFELCEQTDKKLVFALVSNEETKQKYPFDFRLEIAYELMERKVLVYWNVYNEGQKNMYFSIGGHPAFMCPLEKGKKQTDCMIYMGMKKDSDVSEGKENLDKVTSTVIGKTGLASERKIEYTLQNGLLPITDHLFDDDALVIEHNQVQKVAFTTQDQVPYLAVSFDAPLFGIWSPPKMKAPFICIEPWYGRCDAENFEGDLAQREWSNQLAIGEKFASVYTIEV